MGTLPREMDLVRIGRSCGLPCFFGSAMAENSLTCLTGDLNLFLCSRADISFSRHKFSVTFLEFTSLWQLCAAVLDSLSDLKPAPPFNILEVSKTTDDGNERLNGKVYSDSGV